MASELRMMKDRDELKERLEESEKALAFVEHIEDHLDPGQTVICKICCKMIDEIYKEKIRKQIDWDKEDLQEEEVSK